MKVKHVGYKYLIHIQSRENLDDLMHKFTQYMCCTISQRQVGNRISLSKVGPLKTMTQAAM